jgi:hypothetical protein
MIAIKETGTIELQNLPKAAPFKVVYVDYGDSIQLDVSGIGVFKYYEPISASLKCEINTNINNKLVEYTELTGHNSADIGYYITYSPKRKLNTSTNTGVMGVEMSIFFKKPCGDTDMHQLLPTIKLLSLVILDCFIYLP